MKIDRRTFILGACAALFAPTLTASASEDVTQEIFGMDFGKDHSITIVQCIKKDGDGTIRVENAWHSVEPEPGEKGWLLVHPDMPALFVQYGSDQPQRIRING